MASSKSANAVLAKARAKYGRHLTDKDYASLLTCKNVAEVVTYLKNNTYYDTVLKNVNEREIHRGMLELILRQKLSEDFYSLCRYTKGAGEQFAQYILERQEISQLVHFLTHLSSGGKDAYIFNMPDFFLQHTDVDWNALSLAANEEQFFSALSGSKYEALLRGFKGGVTDPKNIPYIENKLCKSCFDNLNTAIEKYSSGQERKELKAMFNSVVDYLNFVRAIRLKKYYHASAATTADFMYPYGTLSKKTVQRMCEAQSSAEVFDAVRSTSFGKQVERIDYRYAGEIDKIGIYRLSRKNIHFSSFPLVVMLSYVHVVETEYSNIVSIIEGVRYSVEPDKIKTVIIT